MDQSSAPVATSEATPIFGAYRRGYDPVQVDRYVAEQQRRLDEALARASESERKLAAAVGQLRELHRRVAVLESEDRSPQPAPLDALGERVQRILQEAWEGAYALRQQAEAESAAVRERAAGDAAEVLVGAEQRAAEVVGEAERRAAAIDAEIERRRVAWNARLEEDRAKAVAQLEHLHRQRNDAVNELLRLRGMIEKAVEDLGTGHVGAAAAASAAGMPAFAPAGDEPTDREALLEQAPAAGEPAVLPAGKDEQPPVRVRAAGAAAERSSEEPAARREDPPVRLQRPRPRRTESEPTVATPAPAPLDQASWVPEPYEPSGSAGGEEELTALVRIHRGDETDEERERPGVFDFEEM